jgi:hypothetical protein
MCGTLGFLSFFEKHFQTWNLWVNALMIFGLSVRHLGFVVIGISLGLVVRIYPKSYVFFGKNACT